MVLVIPYTQQARVERARFLLAEVQGFSAQMGPTAMLYGPTQISESQWEHYLSHLSIRTQIREGAWASVPVPPRSEWCTLLLYGAEAYLFNRAGAVCFFPPGAVADPALFRGTLLAGDLSSEVVEDTVVWTFRVVHALVVRGTLVVGVPLALRVAAAARALQGLRTHRVGPGEWRFVLAQPEPFRGVQHGALPNVRLLHTQTTPDASLLWALELPHKAVG